MILFTSSVFAQTISGSLVDKTSDQALEYASVVLYQLPDSTMVTGVITDLAGKFEFKDIPQAEYYLTAQFMGYVTEFIYGVKVNTNKPLKLDVIALMPGEKMLEEIQVSGQKATTMHKVDRQVYDAGSFQSASGGTASDVLRNLPSVSLDAQGEISVRGTTGFAVLLNGKPVQTAASVILNQLPANAIEKIEIITSPSASYDPEGKGGIINIITSQQAMDGTFVQVNGKWGLPSIENYDNAEKAPRYGADFTLNYRKNKWDISLGGSYLRNDMAGRREGDVYTILNDTLTRLPSDGERSFDELGYSGRFTLGYTPNPYNHFSLGFYAGKRSKDRLADIVYYDNHTQYPPFSGDKVHTMQYYNHNLRIRRSDFAMGSLDYKHTFQNQSVLSSSFLYEYSMLGGPTVNQNQGWPDKSIMYQDEYNTNDNPLNGIRFQADYQSKPLSFGTIEIGYQFRNLNHIGDFIYERRNESSGDFELIPEFSSSVNLTRAIHAVYGQLTGTSGKLSYGLGLRMETTQRKLELKDRTGDFDSTYQYNIVKPYPSGNLQYAINEEWIVKAGYSKRVERTTTFKMNPFPEREHSETLEQGDPTLLPEFIDLLEAGTVKYFGNSSIYATAYYQNVKNVINRANTVYNDSILNRIYSNVGNSKSLGLELGTELQLFKWWKLFAGGNLYRYNLKGSFDNRPINSSSWVYSINANTTFDLSSTFHLQWGLNYLSDRVTAQGKDSRFLSPNLSLKKTFLDKRLSATLQWTHMDLGLLPSNEQRISTWRKGEFYTTTNYVNEVDVIMINLSYSINNLVNKAKFIKSEFGEKEF